VRGGTQSDAFSLPQSRHGLPPLMRPPPGGLPISMASVLSPESRTSIQLTGSPARRVVPLAVNPDLSQKRKRGKGRKGKESALPVVAAATSGRGISAGDLDSESESVIIGPEPGPLIQDTIKAPVTMAEVNRRRRRILRRINWTLLILSFLISITVLVMVCCFVLEGSFAPLAPLTCHPSCAWFPVGTDVCLDIRHSCSVFVSCHFFLVGNLWGISV
jgi:hypothetical protein